MHWQHTNLANFDLLWIISYFSTTHPVLANLSIDQVKINVAEAMKGAIHLLEKRQLLWGQMFIVEKAMIEWKCQKEKKKKKQGVTVPAVRKCINFKSSSLVHRNVNY